MKEISKFVCDHCNREYRVKKNAEKHESKCWLRKSLKCCPTCEFYDGMHTDYDHTVYGHSRYVSCKNDECDTQPDDEIPTMHCEWWKERTKNIEKIETLEALNDKW